MNHTETKPCSSPLYTPSDVELAKRTILEKVGKDTDGAFRVGPKRRDGKTLSNAS